MKAGPARDLPEAVRFYAESLGFEVSWQLSHEVADQPHGMRECDLEDPSGNCICFGQPIP